MDNTSPSDEGFFQNLNIDSLTGLYSSRLFQPMLACEIARAERYRTPLTILLLDIDDFKKVNDTYGHVIGNKVLKSLAAILQSSVRALDVIFRTGGSEFGILFPHTGREGAACVRDRIQSRLEASEWLHDLGLEAPVTVTTVLREYQVGETRDFMSRAGDALDRAKRLKKNGDDDDSSSGPAPR
jgi:diguanylate cyclase (GGDEF)-like protein